MRPLCLLLLASCAETTAATSSDNLTTQGAVEAQLNDVSILYPLVDDQNAYVNVLDAALGLKTILDQMKIPETESAGIPVKQADFHITALRLDPCFAGRSPCANQLRVVFQTPRFDAGIHAFYSLTRTELLAIVKRMADARGNAKLGALSVHPLLQSQGLDGPFGLAVAAMLRQYARVDRLTRITLFSEIEAHDNWSFIGFDVTNAMLTPMQIPAVVSEATELQIAAITNMRPDTSSSDNMRLLLSPSGALAAPPQAQQAALDAVFRIENPTIHTSESIDCGSCHMADPVKVRVAKNVLGLSIEDNPNAYSSAFDLTQTTPVSTAEIPNLHMFSYLGSEPMIMQRTINETAQVVSYLNSLGR